jgi:hypothetical protein
MKAHSSQKKQKFVPLSLLTIILLAICIWVTLVWMNPTRDILRENLTIKEAQDLVSFPICIPTYEPPEINPEPQIIYDADAANVPQETYIRLRYQHAGNHQTEFEVYQRYTQDSEMKTAYPEMAHNGAKVNLLNWISYPNLISESEIEETMTRTQMASSVFQTNGTVWWLYEIINPIEYHATMTKWVRNHVEYRILSFLSTEEIKKITLSMLDCSNP